MDNLILKFLKYEEAIEFIEEFSDIPFPGIKYLDFIEELYLENPINSIIQILFHDNRIGYIVQEFSYNNIIYLYYGIFDEYRNKGLMKISINQYIGIIKEKILFDELYREVKIIEADCMDLISYNVLKNNGFVGGKNPHSKLWNMKYIL